VSLRNSNIALVHDWLNQLGGAENVLEELVALFPGAPVYTSMYAAQRMPASYRQWDIRTSFMQRLPGVATQHQAYLPLYPLAFATTDLRDYDLVISNKSGFCHGVKIGDTAQRTRSQRRRPLHVCYCLTPTRYLWLFDQYRKREQLGSGLSLALQPLLALLRRWDWAAAQGVDHFVAISTTVQQRIRMIYGRESVIIHPPVDTEFFTPAPSGVPLGPASRVGDFFLIVSRLIPYKRIDLAIQAFRRLPQERLVIVGEGRDLANLQAQASDNISFLGRQDRSKVRELLRRCKAFLFPGLEDFGIAPVEALSCGRPVIAFGEGGALDTVMPGVTGELFTAQTCESLLSALKSFDALAYDPAHCRTKAEEFSAASFRENLLNFLSEKMVNG
jgi:glycosyltransferase involved in cell wall biosynthesis